MRLFTRNSRCSTKRTDIIFFSFSFSISFYYKAKWPFFLFQLRSLQVLISVIQTFIKYVNLIITIFLGFCFGFVLRKQDKNIKINNKYFFSFRCFQVLHFSCPFLGRFFLFLFDYFLSLEKIDLTGERSQFQIQLRSLAFPQTFFWVSLFVFCFCFAHVKIIKS